MNTVSIRSVRQVSPLFLAAAIVVLSFLQARAEVTVRARVVEIEPEARVRIFWTWGGQGLGGTPFGGEWTEVPLDTAKPLMPSTGMTSSDALDALLMPDDKSAGDVLIENGKASDYHWLAKGVWSPELPIGNLYYRTVYARGCAPGDAGKAVAIKHAVFEFEVLQDGESVAKFTEESPSGAVCTVVLPGRMVKDGKVMPGFLEHACGLYELSRWRMEWMESLPWAGKKLPRRYEIISNLSGYGTDHGYGVRTSSLKVMSHEARTMRQMGINGVRHNPRFLMDAELRERCPAIKDLTYFTMSRTGGYPFPGAPRADSTGKRPPLPWGEGVGCPWHPAHSNRVEQARKEVEPKIAEYQGTPFVSSWELTVDEIGSAFDGTAEGKAHQGTCQHCTAKFREYLKDKGLIPRDFDVADWEPIRSTFGYFEKSYEQRMKEEAEGRERDRPKLMVPGEMPGVSEAQTAGLLGVEGAYPAEKANAGMSRDETVVDLSDADVEAGGSAEAAKALA